MVAIRVPDKLSVVTYVSQYYNYFHDKPQLGGPGVNKFNKSAKTKGNVTQPVNKSLTPAKTNLGNAQLKTERQESIGDKCTICHEKVYLLERHIENSKLYHRSCFRKSELSPTSKVFKRQPYSPLAEEKNDLISTKHRKIDSAGDKNVPKEDGLDFWQRRAQQKAKESESKRTNETPVVKTESKPEPKVTTQAVNSDVPIWKRGLEKKDKLFDGGGAKEKEEPKIKTGLADKFKELDQRNLKSLSDTDHVKNVDKIKERDKKDISDTKKKFESKPVDNKVVSPVAKPRQNVLNRIEKMDTDNNESHVPKPVQRFQKKDEKLSPKASPRKIDHKSKSPPTTKKNDLTRPKTPPNKHKTEFSLNLTNNVGKSVSAHKVDSPSSPPPLPANSPPRLPKSSPPKQPFSNQSMDSSPVTSPRTANKQNKATDKDKPIIKSNIPPSKPPRTLVEEKPRSPSPVHKDRISKFADKGRSTSPMDTSEMHVAPKANIKGPKTEYTAAIVVPNRPQDEEKNREVFGGLLKSLAGVRQKYDVESDNKGKLTGANSDKENKSMVKINGAIHEEHGLRQKLDKINEPEIKDLNKGRQVPQRPKSSFVSQSSSLFDSEGKRESNVKVDITKKTTTKTTVVTYHIGDKTKGEETKSVTTATKVEDDVPEWKRALEQRKKDQQRPKSADILSEKSDIGNVPQWKIEADKRKEARQGGYVDPEKVKRGRDENRNNAALDLSRALSPVGRKKEDISDKYVPPIAEQKIELPQRHKIEYKGDKIDENQKPAEVHKKKITVDHKFKFEDIELKPAPKKPPRPATQPSSPKSPTSHGPVRPPPPKTEGFKPGRHHISAYQIQTQLQQIDRKLTQLELKGRTLEDSIRNAKDEEEDDLMIAWFQLVNEKNNLVRTECDYIYVSREQELELEQQQIVQQLRELADKPEKTEEDIKEEEHLMEKLMDVVNQRSKIVDSIDEDRIRYMDEDSHIEAMLQQKAFSKQYKKPKKKKKLGEDIVMLLCSLLRYTYLPFPLCLHTMFTHTIYVVCFFKAR
ncbi:MICAL-like protein 1 isoform X2 [Mercenaria mercenaria]|nr:MICAL-like protein 1 isoform X2 [Mercenaria mercenaria]